MSKQAEITELVADCPHCGKPIPLCICDSVTPIENRIAVLILQHERARALQHTRGSTCEAGGMTPRPNRFAAGLDADQSHTGILDERVEDADRIAAATDTRDHRMR